VIALPQVLTLAQARAAAQALEQAVAATPAGATLVVDASALQAFDTSALAALLQGQRAASARGVAVSLQGTPAKLVDLARLYGVDELLPRTA
jgi:phospholipid transport system transporter-binding protein